MAQFLGDIAFLLEVALVAGGLVLLHRARQEGAGLLRVAAVVLVLGGAGTAICTGWYWFHYHAQGDFDRAHPASMGPMMPGGMGRMGGMGGRMGPGGGPMPPGGMHEPGTGRRMQPPSESPPPSDR